MYASKIKMNIKIKNDENKKYRWFIKFLIELLLDLLKREIKLAIILAKTLIIVLKNIFISFTDILKGNSIKFAMGFLCKFCGNK